MVKHIIYHENNRQHPYIPQEDAYAHKDNIYVVADGVTHDRDQNGMYPIPSDSAKVAQMISGGVVAFLKNKKASLGNIKAAYLEANRRVQHFNETRPFYKDRENNGYTIGAATAAMVWFDGNKLLYGVIDDCFISVFSGDCVDHPVLKSYVEQSARYLDTNFDWSQPETRKLWRKEIRNNVYSHGGKEYGYGAIDGREGFVRYLQLGEVELKKDDLVCVYTDGFIKVLQNVEFVKGLREQPFSMDTYEYIKGFSDKLDAYKEKTSYFVKH